MGIRNKKEAEPKKKKKNISKNQKRRNGIMEIALCDH